MVVTFVVIMCGVVRNPISIVIVRNRFSGVIVTLMIVVCGVVWNTIAIVIVRDRFGLALCFNS
jgi:hypothetical protein